MEIEAARATALRVQSALEEQSHSTLSSAEQEVCYKKLLGHRKTTSQNVFLSGLTCRHKARVTKEIATFDTFATSVLSSIQAYIPSKNLHT